jgi:hydroxypyruvate reductase
MIRNGSRLAETSDQELALDCIQAGISAAQPDHAIKNALEKVGEELRIEDTTVDLTDYSSILVLGGGKAAAQMARTVEGILGDRITDGTVVTNDPIEIDEIDVVEGGHPVPNANGRDGAEQILSLAEQATEETLVLCVISGGGSALLPAPAGDVSFSDLQELTDRLLSSGATIQEINAVRKHLSSIKGGRLATTAAPATVVGLFVSDVVGNDLSAIASGPIVPDDTTFETAQDVLKQYGIDPPTTIRQHLVNGVSGRDPETPGPDHPAFALVSNHLLVDGTTALTAAGSVIEESRFTPIILSSQIEGEARETAKVHTAIAEEASKSGNPVEPPVVFLSGGETTVTIRGDGTGGPNQEFVLSGALSLSSEDIVVASVDTDGIDGATDAAGALATTGTIPDPAQARTALAENDAYSYLGDKGAIIRTGPTGTNVNDLRVIVVPGE